jgi:hypothetical protein
MSGISNGWYRTNQDNEAWQQESWTASTGKQYERQLPIHSAYHVCLFKDNVHYPAEYYQVTGELCPHEDEADEMGTIHKPGWTVLDNHN